MSSQSRTEMVYTAQVSQEMLDTVISFAYMRHYDSGADGEGMVNMAVFNPLDVIDSFVNQDGAWIWEYDEYTPPEVPKWDLDLLFLAHRARAAGASYLILESR